MRANNISVFWIRAYRSILDYCNVLALLSNTETFKEVPQRSILDALLKRTRAHLESAPSRWILIIDGVAGGCDFRDFIEPYLPRNGRVLITSLTRNCSQWMKLQTTFLEIPETITSSNGRWKNSQVELGNMTYATSKLTAGSTLRCRTNTGEV